MIHIDFHKAAFGTAVAAALAFGAGSAVAEERGAREGRHYYCFQEVKLSFCQSRCAAAGHQWDTFIGGQCCCVDL